MDVYKKKKKIVTCSVNNNDNTIFFKYRHNIINDNKSSVCLYICPIG